MLRTRILPRHVNPADALQQMGSNSKPQVGPVIRVLVWNILKARRRAWAQDFANLVHDRDVALLQEAVSNAPSDGIFTQSQRFQWIMARSHEHGVTGVVTGVKTGCVAPAISAVVHASPHTEPLVNTQKLLLETHYALAGETQTLMVLNMHAINFVSVKKYEQHINQLSGLLNAHTGPVILAGDFNTWNPQRFQYFEKISKRSGLLEAVMQRRGRIAHLKQHLDHVFYRGLTLRLVASLSHIQSSDHYPITATFIREPTKKRRQ